jgi:glyoxylase-like metal-dependent hydrolase (beta-lactamase superfamily II)
VAHYAGDDVNVHKIEVGDMGNNVYILECPETHESLVIDGCFEAERILEAASATTVVGIVQTHGHSDHVQALPEIKEALGVEVMAGSGDDFPVQVERRLTDGERVTFGKREVEVLHTPGHSPGSICLLIGSQLISGDTLFPGGPGNTFGNEQAFEQIIGSLRSKLFTLPDETNVYPGHGDDTTIGAEKPHLQEWIDRGW